MPEPKKTRAIELEIEVAGTPEEVWEAIATGQGITAWFVPTTVEQKPGGAIVQDFGPGPEMKVAGHVHAWEPPHLFAYGQHPEPTEGGMAFEFQVEAKDRSTCIVRLVNSGFGHGEAWDDQYDGTEHGWRIFLHLLSLHLERFKGQPASRVQAMAMVPAPDGPEALWTRILQSFDIDGDHLAATAEASTRLSATITFRISRAIAFAVHEPAPGIGFLAAEGRGDTLALSLWLSLYGPTAAEVAQREAPRWQAWADRQSGTAHTPAVTTPTQQAATADRGGDDDDPSDRVL